MPPFDREAASAAFSRHARHYDDLVVGPVDKRERLDENVVVGTANRRERLSPVAHPRLNRVGRVDVLDVLIDVRTRRAAVAPSGVNRTYDLHLVVARHTWSIGYLACAQPRTT